MDCLIEDCNRPRKESRTGAGKYCSMHYERRRLRGEFGGPAPEVNQGGVWKGSNGYLKFSHEGKETYVHRYEWETHRGSIPEGFHVHHIDGDRLNNSLDNLELITESDHHKYHDRELQRDSITGRILGRKEKEGLSRSTEAAR